MTDFSRVAQEVFDKFDVPCVSPHGHILDRLEPIMVGDPGAQLQVWPDRLSLEVGGIARNLTHIYWIGPPMLHTTMDESRPTKETIRAFTKLPLLTGSSILTGRVTNERLLRLTNYALTGVGWRTYLQLGNAAVLDIGSLVNCSQGEEALEQIEANSRAGTPFVSLSPNYGTGSYRPLTFDTKS